MNYKKLVKYKKYLITKPTDVINNDHYGHIHAFIQNLILMYTPKCTINIDFDNPLSISHQASELHNALEGSQSAIWCPLIYNALKYAGHTVPNGWTIYQTKKVYKTI